MKHLFNPDKADKAFALALVFGALLAAGLVVAGLCGLGYVTGGITQVLILVLCVGIAIYLAFLIALGVFAYRESSSELHAPEMSTLSFPPPATGSRAKGVTRLR